MLEYWFLSACITPLFHHSTTPVPLGFAALQYVIASHTLMTPNGRANRRRADASSVLGVESHGGMTGNCKKGT